VATGRTGFPEDDTSGAALVDADDRHVGVAGDPLRGRAGDLAHP
jgi:hypothetical protein